MSCDTKSQTDEGLALVRLRWEMEIPLTVGETAIITGIAERTLYRWRSEGRVNAILGEDRRPRFTRCEILRMLGAQQNEEAVTEERRGHDKSDEIGDQQMAHQIQVHGPTDGSGTDLSRDSARTPRRGESPERQGPCAVPTGKSNSTQPIAPRSARGILHALASEER